MNGLTALKGGGPYRSVLTDWRRWTVSQTGTPQRQTKVTITIDIQPGNTPPATRLRKLLKVLLRSLGMRCIECREQSMPDELDLSPDERKAQ
ncbi:MAG: hypothetical protein ACK5Q5_04545 [Planctomycetaceae bacterium]